jgi:hypothetical protein
MIGLTSELVRQKIFKYLDWNSRIEFNLILRPEDRIGTKLKKISIDRHENFIIFKTLQSKLNRFERANNDLIIKVKIFIDIILSFKNPRFYRFVLGNKSLKETILQKCNEFSCETSYRHVILTDSNKNWIKQSISACFIIKSFLKKKDKLQSWGETRFVRPIVII